MGLALDDELVVGQSDCVIYCERLGLWLGLGLWLWVWMDIL